MTRPTTRKHIIYAAPLNSNEAWRVRDSVTLPAEPWKDIPRDPVEQGAVPRDEAQA